MCEIFNLVDKLNEKYARILKEELKTFDDNAEARLLELKTRILNKRKEVSCGKCGSCCRLAACPNSPEELKEKANNGDKFAKEFINTFTLYENIEEVEKLHPEYVKAVKSLHEKIYFYHCNLVTKDNLCPKYEDRPQICRDYPDNPLEIYPVKCEYKKWRDNVLDDMLRVKAINDILNLEKR